MFRMNPFVDQAIAKLLMGFGNMLLQTLQARKLALKAALQVLPMLKA